MSDIYRRAVDATGAPVDVECDAAGFIRDRLRPKPVAAIPQIHLYGAHSGSGLLRLAARGRNAPYWAYAWAGGLALVRYIEERPETVAHRRVLDFGAGSGLVAIAAALGGASHVVAVETDPVARAAITANAALNGVQVDVVRTMPRAPRDIDLVLAGDVFYASRVGRRSLMRLESWHDAGIAVLVGDPYRPHLPLTRLRRLADYKVPDVGSGAHATSSGVFMLEENSGDANA